MGGGAGAPPDGDDADRPRDDREASRRKSAAAASFGDSAEGYRTSRMHREGADLERLVGWCAGAERALDVATGAGHTAGGLRRVGVPDVVALDAAPAMVATAEADHPGVAGVVGDAERLPFAAEAFDAVTCRIAPHHFPDPAAFVAEVARVVRPGGTFALEDNVAPEDEALADWLNDLEALRDPTHGRSYPTSTWTGWLEAAGFAVEETVHLLKPLAYEPWVHRPGVHDAAGVERVRRHLVDAPPAAVEAFDVRVEDGEPVRFGSLKGLLRAVRVG